MNSDGCVVCGRETGLSVRPRAIRYNLTLTAQTTVIANPRPQTSLGVMMGVERVS
jgi:hypothetical protein